VVPDSELVLRLLVTDAGAPAPGVKLVSRVNLPDQKAAFTDATTDAQGAAEMKFTLNESALSEASILVQANHAGRTATRKFSFRKSDS
jgi:trimethylamine:corrinoid methyltransferase-like protein